MKRTFILLLSMVAFMAQATDRVVEQSGVSPVYSSIQAAINAASDGDRILIKNRPGNIPWIEDLTIAKSLELLSYDNDVQWIIQGNVLVTSGSNRDITVLGMRNLSGYLGYTTSGGSSRSTHVKVIDCSFESGYIGLQSDAYILDVIHTDITDGYIYNYNGDIIGCELNNSTITIYNGEAYRNETVRIIGNKISTPESSSYGFQGIDINNVTYDFEIKNNLIMATRAISVEKSASSQTFYIYNNSIRTTRSTNTSGTHYGAKGLELRHSGTGSSSATYEIMNNAIDMFNAANVSNWGIDIYGQNGDINVYYNWIDSDFAPEFSGTPTVDFANNITTAFDINADGSLPGGSPCIDGANPDPSFYDLDLSTGDAGCFGGSYTLDNFFPLHTGSARIYMVDYPFQVRQGSTLNIDADSYDR
jgi:hypothetical protein